MASAFPGTSASPGFDDIIGSELTASTITTVASRPRARRGGGRSGSCWSTCVPPAREPRPRRSRPSSSRRDTPRQPAATG